MQISTFWQWHHLKPLFLGFQENVAYKMKKMVEKFGGIKNIAYFCAIELEQTEKNGCDEGSNE